jgi:hypothetical protein
MIIGKNAPLHGKSPADRMAKSGQTYDIGTEENRVWAKEEPDVHVIDGVEFRT